MIAYDHMQTEIPEGNPYEVTVIGIGGAGSNVIDRLALDGMGEAEIVCMNTDVRGLSNSMAGRQVQLGAEVTKGLGAGGDPELGLEVAKASEAEIRESVEGRDIVFLCVGLGGGTGSGAAPFVAKMAKEAGAFVVAFAIMPFGFEGRRRRAQAEEALESLSKECGALLTFENGRMGELVLPKEGIQAAFAAADQVIGQSVRAVTGIVLRPGLIRIGMDDLIRALENEDSRCLFGYGEAKGDSRAQEALTAALRSPLLERGALLSDSKNVLVHVTGGKTMTLIEVELLMDELGKQIGEEAQILFGTGHDPKLGDRLAVTVISSLAPVVADESDVAGDAVGRDEVGGEAVVAPVDVAELVEFEVPEAPETAADEELAEVEGRMQETSEVASFAPDDGELALGEIEPVELPKVETDRTVASEAMVEIEEAVAETLFDLGMDEDEDLEAVAADPIEGEEEVSEAVADGVAFVEVDDEVETEAEAAGDEVEAAPAAEVEIPDEIFREEAPAVEATSDDEVAEAVSDEGEAETEAPVEASVDVVEEMVAEMEPEPEPEPDVEVDAAVSTEDEEVEAIAETDEVAEADGVDSAVEADAVAEDGDYFLAEEEVLREAVEDEMPEEEPPVAEETSAGVQGEAEGVPMPEAEGSDQSGVDYLESALRGEEEAAVPHEDEVAGHEEEAPVMEEAVSGDEEEVMAPAAAYEEEPVLEETVGYEEEPAIEEAATYEDAPVMDDEPAFEEEPVLEEPVGYQNEPAYEDEPLQDDAPAYVDEPVRDEEPAYDDEPALAMAADSGHPDPADVPPAGSRIGLVEPSASDPTGQGMLELERGSAGRFEKGARTLVDGEDLDVPTFLRKRGMK